MAKDNSEFELRYALGTGTNLAKAKNKTCSLASFYDSVLKTPLRTAESRRDFNALAKDDQDSLKAANGWFSGAQCEGRWRNRKNVLPRNNVTLDLDYIDSETYESLKSGTTLLGKYEFLYCTTRRHTEDQPRVRIILPVDRDVSPEEYGPLVRIIAFYFEGKRTPMEMVDKVSARPAQMMFSPTVSQDGVYESGWNKGNILRPDNFFKQFKRDVGDWHDLSRLPLFDTEENLRTSASKAEDPTAKKGPIGVFCRRYSVEDVMEQFLPGTYIPGDEQSGKPRYTYAGSTSSNGAIVEDDGLFLYSHHGHDPNCEKLVNAFDLLRTHKFGHLDEKVTSDTPIMEYPSFKTTMSFMRDDKGFQEQQIQENYDLTAIFENEEDDVEDSDSDITDGFENESGDAQPNTKPNSSKKNRLPNKKRLSPKELLSQLEYNNQGVILNHLANVTLLVGNDPRMGHIAAFNKLTNRTVLRGDLVSNVAAGHTLPCADPVEGVPWEDRHDIAMRLILETPNAQGAKGYGLKVTDRDLSAAIGTISDQNTFDPRIEEYESLVWDGESRMDDWVVRYMGTPDTKYHRDVGAKLLLAMVARTYEPGCKFDYMGIIAGPQGCRKSTLVRLLAGKECRYGVFDCDINNPQRVAENLLGKHVIEMDEMEAMKKADHTTNKSFLRKQKDEVRMAYARHPSTILRTCIVIGTTNESKVLRDATGNRSYWVIFCRADPIDTDAFERERAQLMAEAVARYKEMRQERPVQVGSLDLSLDKESEAEAGKLQESMRSEELFEEMVENVVEYLETPISLADRLTEEGKPLPSFTDETVDGPDPEDVMVLRTRFERKDINEAALGRQRPSNPAEKLNMEKTLDRLSPYLNYQRVFFGRGARKRLYVLKTASDEDIIKGYKLVEDDPLGF